MIGQKISRNKYCRCIEQVRKAWPSMEKKDISVSFLEKGSETIFEQLAVERD